MDLDFTALASRVAARAEILGCVILSRDGLVLGAFPPNGEQDITPGLMRFAALGEPERGFVQFSDELWAYLRQGSYAVFAVAEADTRPGILLDYLEQALLVAGESRSQRSAVSEPAHVDLNRKGVRPGRRLRAATSPAEEEFRSTVVAAEHKSPSPPEVPLHGLDDLERVLAEAVAQVEPSMPFSTPGDDPDEGGFGDDDLPDDPGERDRDDLQDELGEGLGDDFRDELQDQLGDQLQEELQDDIAGEHRDPNGFPAPEIPAAPVDLHPAVDDEADWQAEAPPPDLPAAPDEIPSDLGGWGEEPPAEPDGTDRDAPAKQGGHRPEEIDRVALAREFASLLQEGPAIVEEGQ